MERKTEEDSTVTTNTILKWIQWLLVAVLILLIPMVFLLRYVGNRPINPAPEQPINQEVALQSVENAPAPIAQAVPTFDPERGRRHAACDGPRPPTG